ncbi:MAG TPA: glycosyltransferase family A protein [Methylomirabilota bacterium]|nr:glycosyltransferase family A protein [Methylomirabilota bacterium]
MPDPVNVSVIMPTEARPERAELLRRALESVRSQQGVRAIPIVVVNGPAADPPLLADLARADDVQLVRLEAAGLPAALRAGRDRVRTPYFAELDDDDELLPGALRTRVEALEARPDVDVVVTRGYVDRQGHRELNVADLEAGQGDPLRSLLDHNWLAPCAALFRTATIGTEHFADVPPYLEWTYLGLRLAVERRILFLNQPTWIYRADTPHSLSKAPTYVLRQAASLDRLLALPLPRDVRRRLRRRRGMALHAAASLELRAGQPRAAWRWHLRSLAAAGGWRYTLYTRRLVYGLWQAVVGGR